MKNYSILTDYFIVPSTCTFCKKYNYHNEYTNSDLFHHLRCITISYCMNLNWLCEFLYKNKRLFLKKMVFHIARISFQQRTFIMHNNRYYHFRTYYLTFAKRHVSWSILYNKPIFIWLMDLHFLTLLLKILSIELCMTKWRMDINDFVIKI